LQRTKFVSWKGKFQYNYRYQNNTDLHNLGVLLPYFACPVNDHPTGPLNGAHIVDGTSVVKF
jgi:hypothetical protein